MDFGELVLSRYSCRNYANKPLDRKLIESLFEIVRFAPSAVNYQPWEFLVVDDKTLLQKIYYCYSREWLKTAPAVIIALANTEKAWIRSDGKNHADIDLSIIIDHLTLAAVEKGLATCWVCNFSVKELNRIFNLPKHLEAVALIPIGYPETVAIAEKKRKPIAEILHFNSIS